MNRLYVGIACTAHDPAIAIVNDDGDLVYAQAAERHLQNKRAWFSSPISKDALRKAIAPHLRGDTRIVVAFSWILAGEFAGPVEFLTQPNRLMELDQFASLLLGTLSNRAIAYLQLRDFLASGRIARSVPLNAEAPALRCFEHHSTHAAYACYSSAFTEAVCAIMDGWGEGEGSAFYHWVDGNLKEIKATSRRLPTARSGSLGLFYSTLCETCGFDATGGEEWKVMGLAAYGRFDPQLYALLRPVLVVDDLWLLAGCEDAASRWAEISKRVGDNAPPLAYADLAHTGQKIFEEISTELLTNLRRRGLSQNLILGGGCALNSLWNGRITDATGFSSLFVPAAPADDGNAVGAAWLAYREDHSAWRPTAGAQSPYLGDTLEEQSLRNAIEYGGLKPSQLRGKPVQRRAAELLAEGKILGWVQGRAEFGPRALGNRSILADPRRPDIKQVINERVKFREEFRPFAPSILHERGPEYFENYQESPYMDRTLMLRTEKRRRVPGIVHEDGSGRLQSVKREWNPRFYDLIVEFDSLTGVPLLLNTSFNVMGKPIIHSAEDALAVYMTTGLDALVLGDVLFEKDDRVVEGFV